MIPLAEALDQLVNADLAVVSESAQDVTVARLSVLASSAVLDQLDRLGWAAQVVDRAANPTRREDLDDGYGPYRIHFRKPHLSHDVLWIVSTAGLVQFLRAGHPATLWRVARLRNRLLTLGRLFLDWETDEPFVPSPPTKSPRSLVREMSAVRKVPEDVRPWIQVSVIGRTNCPAWNVWAEECSRIVLLTLADEIDAVTQALKFKGPPRLSLTLPGFEIRLMDVLGVEGFSVFQEAAHWVYENDREAEMRHILLSNELARSGGGDNASLEHFGSNIAGALEGARIAYQMSISALGKDTLKALADLRKAVTEDTAKVTDATRQSITAVAGALAVGFGLLAARLTTNAPAWLILAIVVVIGVYVATVLWSGWGFVNAQKSSREQWQSRLYRFLPQGEYEQMVMAPTASAEGIYMKTTIGGALAVIILLITVLFGPLLMQGGEVVANVGDPPSGAHRSVGKR